MLVVDEIDGLDVGPAEVIGDETVVGPHIPQYLEQ